MFPLDYTYAKDDLLYKHTVTDAPPCDAFYTHTHNLFEVLYFLSGDATCIIEDRRYKLRRGDLILIRPSKYHFIRIDSSVCYERYDVLFPPSMLELEERTLIPDRVEIMNLADDPVADGVFRRMDYYYRHLAPSHFATLLPLLLRELFFCCSITAKKAEEVEFPSVHPLLSTALQYVNEHLFTIRDVGEIAAAVYVTESYLFRLFKNELKQSPKKYLTSKRLLAAQRLIALGESPTTVYQRCGFGDYTTFYRNYKALFGQSPSDDAVEKRSLSDHSPRI